MARIRKSAPIIALLVIAAVLLGVMLSKKIAPDQPIPVDEAAPMETAPRASTTGSENSPQSSTDPNAPGDERPFGAEEFDTYTAQFLKELPPMEELRALPKHAPSQGLIQGYVRIGEISRAAIRQPQLRETAFETLETCANLPRYDQSIKAMCLNHHRKIRKALGNPAFDEKNRFDDLDKLDRLIRRTGLGN